MTARRAAIARHGAPPLIPSIIIENSDDGRRLIVSDLGDIIIFEVHVIHGEDARVTFFEMSRAEATQMSEWLADMLKPPRRKRPPPTPPYDLPPPRRGE
jgi:hypothetical protein